MSIKLTGELRYDTRGLPEGYDPHKFYEYRQPTRVTNATGIESFAYKYIPFEYLRSFAFAIDPVAAFKVAPMAITPANRKKVRLTASVLNQRFRSYRKTHIGYGQAANYRDVSICWSPYFTYDNWVYNPADTPASQQDPLPDTLNDTTGRTRLFGSNQGELDLFKSYLNSPPRSISETRRITIRYFFGDVEPSCTAAGGSQQKGSGSLETETYSFYPSGGTFSRGSLDALRTQEIAYCKSLCSQKAISMLKDYSPKRREYAFFRNLAELRDLPRSIASLQNTMTSFYTLWHSLATQPSLRKRIFDVKQAASTIPNEYLSYHFGWKQTYNDLLDLLALPEKIWKKNEFLISRAGKPTTFRVKRDIPSSGESSLGFDYDTVGFEYDRALVSRIERESEVRLAINAIFDFPKANVPRFRYEHFLERTGISPRFTDIYNLIPWTWLVDWFTGLGDYVELIDNINHDNNLINWGMISCKTHGKIITDFKSTTYMVDDTFETPGAHVQTLSPTVNRHTSVLNFECQTRSDVATILDVERTAVPSSLTGYRAAILGSLLSQRTFISGTYQFKIRT
jgi:hypothetical protein